MNEAGGPLGVGAPTFARSTAGGADIGTIGFPSWSLGKSLERPCLLGGPC